MRRSVAVQGQKGEQVTDACLPGINVVYGEQTQVIIGIQKQVIWSLGKCQFASLPPERVYSPICKMVMTVPAQQPCCAMC